VLEVSQGKISSREWLLQLMGHVQAALTSSDKRTEAAFLCDIFTLAVIVLSGHGCLVMDSQTLADSREGRHLLLAQSHALVQHYYIPGTFFFFFLTLSQNKNLN
jgi:hypothetical protein